MTDFLREFVIKILCGSTICFVALVIVGNGPNREPTRLCCAAVMIILIFSNQDKISLNVDYLSNIKSDLQNEVSSEMDRVRDFKVEQIISATEKHIIEEMLKEGISCDIELIYNEYNRIIEHSECTIIDGDSGLLSPIALSLQNIDLIKRLQIPTLFVISPREDSINDTF